MKLTKAILVSLIILSSFNYSNGQVMVILQSGDTINTRNTYCHGDTVDLTFTDKPDIQLPSTEVLGLYLTDIGRAKEIKYLILMNGLIQANTDFLPSVIFNSGFKERTTEGKVKLYVEMPKSIGFGGPTMGGYTNDPAIYLQNEEDSIFLMAPPAKDMTKDMQLETLKRVVKNDSSSSKTVSDSNFKLNKNEIVELIQNYNLNQHKYEPVSSIKSTIILFRRDSRYDDQIKIKVEDQEMVFNMYDELEIELAADSNTKICVSSENEKHCQIIRSSRYFTPYYEIPVGRKGQVDIKLVNERYHNDIKLDYGLKKKVISLGTKELTTSNPID